MEPRLAEDLTRTSAYIAGLRADEHLTVFTTALPVESLPDGLGFGQLSDRDFCVVYDPNEGDETPLTCALYMAKVVALASIVTDTDENIDLNGAHREVSWIRGLLEQFAKIETCHSRIDKETTAARTLAADLKVDILAALRRLDSILSH